MVASGVDKGSKSLGRRSFLGWGIGAIGAVLGISYVGLVGDFLRPRDISTTSGLQEVGKTDGFSVNSPTLVSYKGAGGVEEGAYIINLGSEGFIALDFHCTHLECAINWVEASKQFICPCHGGVYDIRGTVLSGPPPRSLHRRVLEMQDNSVMLGGRLT